MIFLAVLTVGLLGSCTKSYDERLDKIDSDVFGLKEAVGQYESLSGDITSVIEALRAEIGTRPASEQQSVWNCIAALQNQKGTFDAAIAALNALVGEKPVSEQIDGAVAKLTSKYQLESLSADIQAIKDKLTEKTGELTALLFVREDEDILLITDDGTIIRARAEDIRLCGRYTQGVRIMRLIGDAKVVGVCRAEREEDSEEELVKPETEMEEGDNTEPADEPAADEEAGDAFDEPVDAESPEETEPSEEE